MRRFFFLCRGRDGFTLLEIVFTITIGALFCGVLISYMGTTVMRGSEPVATVQNGFVLRGILEKMTADYYLLLDEQDPDPLATFKSNIEAGNDFENDPYYGEYSILTEYIIFDQNGNESPDDSDNNRNLKIIITRGKQSLTTLFAKIIS